MSLTKEEYKEKYNKQLAEIGLEGYYRFATSKDARYYRSFRIEEPADWMHQGTMTYAIFYNPETKHVAIDWETDWDREGLDDFSNEVVNSIYDGDCPAEVREDYEKQCELALVEENKRRKAKRLEWGQCVVGDTVEIIKGRKLPIGSIKVIKEFYNYRNKDGIFCCKYAVFTDGTKTNIDNCKLIKQGEL